MKKVLSHLTTYCFTLNILCPLTYRPSAQSRAAADRSASQRIVGVEHTCARLVEDAVRRVDALQQRVHGGRAGRGVKVAD